MHFSPLPSGIFLFLWSLGTGSKVPSFLCDLQSTFQVLIKEFTPANRNGSGGGGGAERRAGNTDTPRAVGYLIGISRE